MLRVNRENSYKLFHRSNHIDLHYYDESVLNSSGVDRASSVFIICIPSSHVNLFFFFFLMQSQQIYFFLLAKILIFVQGLSRCSVKTNWQLTGVLFPNRLFILRGVKVDGDEAFPIIGFNGSLIFSSLMLGLILNRFYWHSRNEFYCHIGWPFRSRFANSIANRQ